MKRIVLILTILCFVQCKQQEKEHHNSNAKQETPPKLVVGIIVDQMRFDYLTRFENKFGDGGFKRLIKGGYHFKNAHYNYVPTYTGPGHASVFTGTSPMNHGIISNTWYDKFSDSFVYCASDTTVTAVGTTSKSERMSPRRMKTTTITDQLRLHTQNKGKTIGIAIKDRGAILPAGHAASGAYWFRGKDEGKWITSTYYRNELPSWVKDFNTTVPEAYMKTWNTLLPIEEYTESGADNNTFEGKPKGKEAATFPYDLKALADENGGYDIIKGSPFGNTLTADFAKAAIKAEAMGKDHVTDFLTLSFSSPDYIGHRYGVNSVEVQDTYLRLDKDLEDFLNFLDTEVGKGNYTVFLTADHGAVHVPNYLKVQKIPAGYFDGDAFRKNLIAALLRKYGSNSADLLKNVSNNQIFLNRELLRERNIDLVDIQNYIAQTVIDFEDVDKVFTGHTLSTTQFTDGIGRLIQNGYHQKYSGDVIVVLDPAVISYPETGSTHGSGLSYDTHVPLVFYGAGINQGTTHNRAEIVDIAPTIAALLGIEFPNGTSGVVLGKVIK